MSKTGCLKLLALLFCFLSITCSLTSSEQFPSGFETSDGAGCLGQPPVLFVDAAPLRLGSLLLLLLVSLLLPPFRLHPGWPRSLYNSPLVARGRFQDIASFECNWQAIFAQRPEDMAAISQCPLQARPWQPKSTLKNVRI